MIIMPDKAFNPQQLNRELAALNLPDFTGVRRSTRDRDTGAKVPPYIEIKVGTLTPAQEQAVRDAVAAHVPDLTPTPREARKAELLGKLKDRTMVLPEILELMSMDRGL